MGCALTLASTVGQRVPAQCPNSQPKALTSAATSLVVVLAVRLEQCLGDLPPRRRRHVDGLTTVEDVQAVHHTAAVIDLHVLAVDLWASRPEQEHEQLVGVFADGADLLALVEHRPL